MRVRLRACVACFLVLPVAWAAAVDFGSLGYEVLSQEREGNRTVYEVENASGNRFSVSAAGEISERSGSAIERILAEFYTWESMDVSYLRITTTDEGATVLVVPGRYEYDGLDLTKYLPSGMQFYVDRIIEYDFRIRVDNVFVRLRGQLNDEQSFTERLITAVEDPGGFIERNDPQYVLRELREIDDTLIDLGLADQELTRLIEQLRERTEEVDDAIRADLAQTVSVLEDLKATAERLYRDAVEAFEELRTDYLLTRQRTADLAADYEKTKTGYLELEERFSALLEDYEALQATYADMFAERVAADQELQEQIELLRYAFIAEASESFFGKLRPVDDETATMIIELKSDNPEMTAKEIAKALSERDIEVTTKGVRFVLLTYLGVLTE